MVVFCLCIKAELDGVSKVTLDPRANICISVRNPLSDFETREKVVINPDEIVEAEGKEPESNFTIKWDGANKRSTLKIMTPAEVKTAFKKAGKKAKDNNSIREMTENDSETFVPVLALDCRGLEPYEFFPMGGEFTVTSLGGKVFDEDVDFSEDDWGEYDDENDIALSISSFESKFIKI